MRGVIVLQYVLGVGRGVRGEFVLRVRIFKLLRSPRIDYKETIPPVGPVRQPYSFSVPGPHRLFKNSSTEWARACPGIWPIKDQFTETDTRTRCAHIKSFSVRKITETRKHICKLCKCRHGSSKCEHTLKLLSVRGLDRTGAPKWLRRIKRMLWPKS